MDDSERMPNTAAGEVQQPPMPRCPHCGGNFESVGWLTSNDGVLTFYHNLPACMMVINVQAIIRDQQPERRVVLPDQLVPRGRG